MSRRNACLGALFALALAACARPDAPADPTAGTEPAGGTMADASTLPEEPPVTPPPIPSEPPPRRMPGTDELTARCDAEAARGAIGQVATAEVVEGARRAAGADVVRTLAPGQMVTMEYHNSRLTLDVDDANVVVGVRCG